MAARSGPNQWSSKGLRSISRWEKSPRRRYDFKINRFHARFNMPQHDEVEILLVEDNADDVELCLHALRKEKLSNKIHVARDGQEALDYLSSRLESLPRLILLDLKLPKVDGIQ